MADPETTSPLYIRNNFDILNPPGLQAAKMGTDEFENYLAFSEDISRNMSASYYMQNDFKDSLITLLQYDESLLAQAINAAVAVDSGYYADAVLMVENMDMEPTADEEGYSSELQALYIELSGDSLAWNQIGEEELNIVKGIALQPDREGIMANLILELTSDMNYEEPVYELDDEITEDELKQINKNYQPSEINSINIYPHPVSNSSIVEVNLEYVTGNEKFIITDIRGKIITQFAIEENISYFKLSNKILSPGVYIGYINCNECKKLSAQIVVVK